ncbi:hypothetical protein TNCV_2201401 [Trichonephila clavipes]|uniref:Uncharacterized protein n=1 Tax=Trichonephila clavipes TaxID=2585209 RepID=A0A8X6VAF8_TRICX|nr:hypothetical protein TNCV_2201401 [Trichonephila clavipes]
MLKRKPALIDCGRSLYMKNTVTVTCVERMGLMNTGDDYGGRETLLWPSNEKGNEGACCGPTPGVKKGFSETEGGARDGEKSVSQKAYDRINAKIADINEALCKCIDEESCWFNILKDNEGRRKQHSRSFMARREPRV